MSRGGGGDRVITAISWEGEGGAIGAGGGCHHGAAIGRDIATWSWTSCAGACCYSSNSGNSPGDIRGARCNGVGRA